MAISFLNYFLHDSKQGAGVMGIPRAFLASPRYGDEIVSDAVSSKINATRNETCAPEDQIEVMYEAGCKSSLLNFGFNQLFAEAMNQRDAGNVDFFVMAHSDIKAEPGWLNTLYGLLRERGDVAVSAVVSIKEPEKRRTSCAVGNRRDYFDVRRYIETTDRLSMPETFSTKDVAREDGEILLINTGLWIADLSWPGFDDFAFSSTDTIKRNPATGKRQAFAVPEDWQMSYWLDANHAPYSGTWKVKTFHYGPSIWCSHDMPPIAGQFVKTSGS